MSPTPQFWVHEDDLDFSSEWIIGFKDLTATTNVRTMIASLVPRSGFGNTLPVLAPNSSQSEYKRKAAVLVACLNSFAYDYLCRQKVHGQHLNSFIVEQIPVIDAENARVPALNATALVKHHVHRLTYTAHDMAPFARDMGHDGPPFVWDETERMHLRARLDALYFILYGVTDRDDVRHIMSTFPIVREKDMKEHGFYLTQELILAYMNALEAGDSETVVDVAALKRAATAGAAALFVKE